ncbi:class I SAM-dependent methyltransferase [Paenibacillus filicis]|uniref:Class I SAM-dependent methyltransferase n=1 Tax=Paenibacillus filicis TaxID=669464 RepID=A0ABU9DMM8_9BACL
MVYKTRRRHTMNEFIKESVQKQFSKNPENYVKNAWHAKGDDLAFLVASSEVEGSMTVLDIATGGGHVANALAPLAAQVTAYDLTRDMLQAAENFIRGNGHDNVVFTEGDAEQLPFADETFDRVTCRIAAHHFPDVPKFVSEAFRVLKPGGKLLLIDNVAPEADELDIFYNDVEKLRDPSHVRAWKKSEWIRVLELSGLRIELVKRFRKAFQFQSWCQRGGVSPEDTALLETKLLQTSPDVYRFFSIETDESGSLVSFAGESVYIQAVKLP